MRIALRDFSAGLVVVPPREHGPPSSLRRATGIRNPALGTALRSRWGSRLLVDPGGTGRLHSLVTFQTQAGLPARYQGVGNTLLLEGTLMATFPTSGPFTFVTGIPVAGVAIPLNPTFLFVAGGGQLVKLETGFGAGLVTPWGIAPPATNCVAGKIAFQTAVNQKIIEQFQNPSAGTGADYWPFNHNPTDGSHVTTGISTTQAPPGAPSSLQLNVGHRNRTGFLGRITTPGLDLAHFSGGFGDEGDPLAGFSSEQDWITLDIMVDRPRLLDSFQIVFGVLTDKAVNLINTGALPTSMDDLKALTFEDSYTFEVRVDDSIVRAQSLSPTGIADIGAVRGDQPAAVQGADSTAAVPPGTQFTRDALESIAITTIPSTDDTWTHLRIPKASFTRPRFDNHRAWERIVGLGFVIRTSTEKPPNPNANFPDGPSPNVFLANMFVRGGTGMQGDYTYRYTYRDPRTFTRSNANPDPVLVRDVPRTGVLLSGFAPPISRMTGAPRREIWRTVGNGSEWFKIAEQAADNPVFFDHVADYEGLHDLAALGLPAPEVMTDEALPFDNIQPEDTFEDVFGPHLGQIFWTRDRASGHEGRVYFSPPGRLEAVAGFVIPGSLDDPMQKGVIWNGSVFVCSTARWWEMQGAGTEWVTREIFGVPGTRYPFSVVPTPEGIFYLAPDGARLFDGNSSMLVGSDAIATLFRGEDAEGIAAFPELGARNDPSRVHAEYWNGEVYLTDGLTTLAVDLRTQAWREVGVPFSALHRERETNLLTVGSSGLVLSWEEAQQLSDAGSPIPFRVELPSLVPDAGTVTKLCQRLYVDCNTRGQRLLATLFKTDQLPAQQGGPFTIITDGRQTLEFALGSPIGAGYVALDGSLTDMVDIYGVEVDMHIPEPPGAGT